MRTSEGGRGRAIRPDAGGRLRQAARMCRCVPFGVLAVAVLAASWWSVVDALDRRSDAEAARKVQMATMVVESADSLRMLAGEPDRTAVTAALEVLNGDLEPALRSLAPDERARARELIAELAGCGAAIVGPTAAGTVPHSHVEFHEVLDTATDEAVSAADAAERRAVTWSVLAALGAFASGLAMARSRGRRRRDRDRAEAEALAGRRLESLIDDSPEIFLVLGRDDRVAFRSASAATVLADGDIAGRDLVALAAPGDRERMRAHLSRSDTGRELFRLALHGAERWFDVRVSDLTDDPVVDGHLVTMRDITDEMILRDELRRLANTDVLTGLPNRRLLPGTLECAAVAVRDQGTAMALLTIDIDGFKLVNDTFGHLAGDELLTTVARRLVSAVGGDGTVLRLGGDEFAVVLDRVAGDSAAVDVAEQLLEVLSAPVRLGDRDEVGRASIGVAVTADAARVADLLHEADVAMYAAKRDGGSAVALFEPALEMSAGRASQVTRALRSAVLDDEMTVVYQPIVAADGADTAGLEALLRWTSPELGAVTPDEFIPLAESSGEIFRIGEWVIDVVCRQVSYWIGRELDPGLSVSINVSPRQLTDDTFVPRLLATASTCGVPPSRLCVEVTESVALEHSGSAAAGLAALRAAGIRISIDDFGSGYSNLGQLLRVPFDVIKIDRSLLLTLTAMRERAGGDPTGSCAIMSAIVAIAGILGAPVVCEGVETDRQRASLRASGIRYVQGFLTGRPSSPSAIEQFLEAGGLLRPEPVALPS